MERFDRPLHEIGSHKMVLEAVACGVLGLQYMHSVRCKIIDLEYPKDLSCTSNLRDLKTSIVPGYATL
ncbi:hypothetical protein WG66_005503 [Moniliophthora roreri]|nr:hypothetical protein WG66_005503 [Moniliophthora roreri]